VLSFAVSDVLTAWLFLFVLLAPDLPDVSLFTVILFLTISICYRTKTGRVSVRLKQGYSIRKSGVDAAAAAAAAAAVAAGVQLAPTPAAPPTAASPESTSTSETPVASASETAPVAKSEPSGATEAAVSAAPKDA
jgi:hypothetical protein